MRLAARFAVAVLVLSGVGGLLAWFLSGPDRLSAEEWLRRRNAQLRKGA